MLQQGREHFLCHGHTLEKIGQVQLQKWSMPQLSLSFSADGDNLFSNHLIKIYSCQLRCRLSSLSVVNAGVALLREICTYPSPDPTIPWQGSVIKVWINAFFINQKKTVLCLGRNHSLEDRHAFSQMQVWYLSNRSVYLYQLLLYSLFLSDGCPGY